MSRDRLFLAVPRDETFSPSCPVASAAFALRVDLFLLTRLVLVLPTSFCSASMQFGRMSAPMSTYMMESPTLSTPSFSHVRT